MSSILKSPCEQAAIEAVAGSDECSRRTGRWVLLATILGSSMAFIDGTVVNVALPVLQAEFGATVMQAQWVVESYALLLAALILVGGALGDQVGRRRIFAIGVGLFALASAACGLAPDVDTLILARAAQGAGGALLVPGSLSIIGATFREEQRGRAIGTWSAFTAMTAVLGPVLGGWLVESFSWRWVFYINLPLAAVVLVMTLTRVPESRADGRPPGLDWPGALLATVGLGGLVYGLIELPLHGIRAPVVLGSILGGAAALVGFLFVELRSRNPMTPPHLFASRTFTGANLVTLFLYAGLGGALFFFPFNLMQVQGYSPTATGAAFLPFILVLFVLSRWAGGLVDRFGARLPLIVGPALAAAGFALFTRPGIGGSYWATFFPALLVLGFGMAVSVAPLTTAVMGAVDTANAGAASGINNAVSRVASLLAIAVLGIFLAGAFSDRLDRRLSELQVTPAVHRQMMEQRDRLAAAEIPADMESGQATRLRASVSEAFVAGFRLVMWIACGLALASSLVAATMIGRDEPAIRSLRE